MERIYTVYYVYCFLAGFMYYPLWLIFHYFSDEETIDVQQLFFAPMLIILAMALSPLVRMKRLGIWHRRKWEVRICALSVLIAGVLASNFLDSKAIWNLYQQLIVSFTDQLDLYHGPVLLAPTFLIFCIIGGWLKQEIDGS